MASDGLVERAYGVRRGQLWTRWATVLAAGSLAVGAAVTGVQAAHQPQAPATPGGRAPAGLVSFSDVVHVDRRTGITATVPRSVTASTSIPVSGVVVLASPNPSRRPVRLQELVGGRWSVIDATRSTRRGGFRFDVAAGHRGRSRTFRVVAPAYDRLSPQRTLARRVQVAALTAPQTTPAPTPTPTGTPTPTTDPGWDSAEYANPHDPAPAGSTRDWSWLMTKTARWDPCTTIRWVYNANGAYAGSLDDMKRSIARVAGRTGLHFRYVGTSKYVPYSGTGTFPGGADLAVGWSDEQHVSRLAGSVVGVGGGYMTYVSGQDVDGRMVQGEVLLDRGASLAHGFTASGDPTWVQVMEHEVMHVVGLGHANGSEEVMAPAVSPLNHFFGKGDLTGMARVGAAHGCLA
jgi:hypothetical protein